MAQAINQGGPFKVDRTFIVEVIILVMVIVSLIISITALSKSSKNEESILSIQQEIIRTNKEIGRRFDSIDAHLMLLEKYARAEYYHFYGDVKDFEHNDNSTTQTKNKKNK